MEQDEIQISRQGRIGRIHLNRPKALNSLTLNMVRRFTRALKDFSADPQIVAALVTGEGDRGLCAGGDIRALYDLRNGDKTYFRTFWREEYELNAMIASYPKPYVVLMDGLVMGGGVGISAHGNRRVVTERTRLAMPEAGIGFIPDVGGTWLLSRSGGAGVYMALSGAAVSGVDAIDAGLADIMIDSGSGDELVARLASARDFDEAEVSLGELRRPAQAGDLARNREALDKAAAAQSVEGIIENLTQSRSSFAQAAAKEISLKSPTSLKVTLALLRRAATTERLEICLSNEYRAACALLESHDLYEGIRAAIIDKDKNPVWSPATLDAVSDTMVARILEGDGSPGPSFT